MGNMVTNVNVKSKNYNWLQIDKASGFRKYKKKNNVYSDWEPLPGPNVTVVSILNNIFYLITIYNQQNLKHFITSVRNLLLLLQLI